MTSLFTGLLVVGGFSPVVALDPLSEVAAAALDEVRPAGGLKASSSRLAETDRELLERDDAESAHVVIKLDYDSIATYEGGVSGLAPTSPRLTGRPLTGTTAAERSYRSHILAIEDAFVAQLAEQVPAAQVSRSLRVVYGGVAASIPANAVETVLAMPGVVAVQENSLEQPLTDSSPEFIGAPAIYDELATTADAGEGVIYGNLDTGIWPEHPSFADLGNLAAPPGPARECNYGDNPLTPAVDVFVCHNKLIGGAHFTDAYDDIIGDDPYEGTARDGDGHGTHTSSTSAGNVVDDVDVLGVNRGTIHGIAPGAWVIEYKVCGPQGCFNSDSAAAVEQAILDGVDVINFSVSGGTNPFADPVELAFLDAYAAGVFVSTAAGNNGPAAGTANHLAPWVTTVAASTQAREFRSTLSLSATGGDTYTVDGASITAGAGPLPVVLAEEVPGYDDPLCGEEPVPGVFAGMIVACQRGTQARLWKSFVVSEGGGAGMVLYNAALADVGTDTHWVPTVHLADGVPFRAFMASHDGVTGSFTAGTSAAGVGDAMAAFSARGPAGFVIKPDITAPGVQILAGSSPTPPGPDPQDGHSPPGHYFEVTSGTSMSSPHVAGSAILLRAVNPDWTPGQIKSALMTTATADVVAEDLATPADPFDLGAGRVDLGGSIHAPLTFDETAANFSALGDDPVESVHLNLPSVNAPAIPGQLTTTRVARNVSGVAEHFIAWTDVGAGSTITVQPQDFTLNPAGSVTLTITIESGATVGAQQLGTVWLQSDGGRTLHLPVAFINTEADGADPGPPFDDVDGHFFEEDITWAFENQITFGCSTSPPLFCPDGSVTRQQMASFLVRALDLDPAGGDHFTDDEASVHEADINALYEEGITFGCTPTTFCPTQNVTREQMASFLVRGFHVAAAVGGDHFTDDELSIHEADINALFEEGITSGCTPTTFCPKSLVTRGQMAAFLHRAMD